MRIVGGKYKSRIIDAPNNNLTRPTSDKTREAIFNIIQQYVIDANVLDLFAGSGALGIEALSRGAKHTTFVDKDYNAINTIKKNCDNLNIENKTILKIDYKQLKNISVDMPFDVVLLDPPYKMKVFDEILTLLEENNLLSDCALVVYETNKENQLSHDYDGYIMKQYRYGIAYVSVLKKIIKQ